MSPMPSVPDRVLKLAREIQQIPAPTFAEARRAGFVREAFERAGLSAVAADEIHNVYALMPGTTGNGLFYGGGWKLFLAQLTGVAAVGVFTFAISLLFWAILKATMGIRVSAEEEIEGLDVGEHGLVAYPEFAASSGYFTGPAAGSGLPR